MSTVIFGQPVHIWQILASIGIFIMALEIFAPGFVLLPIGIAFLLTAIASLFGFQVVSLIAILGFNLLLVFFIIKKVLKLKLLPSEYASNVDSMVGQTVEVTEAIKEGKMGYVKLYGDRWQAALNEGSAEVGEKLKITKVEGNKVIVTH